MNSNKANENKQPQDNQNSSENQKKPERIIQPLNGKIEEAKPANGNPGADSKVNVNSIYPEASSQPDGQNLTTSQAFAQKVVEAQTKESNRLICMRVKSVIAVGILFVLVGVYSTFLALTATVSHGSFGLVFVGLGLIQIIMAVTLFITRDHNTASLILKIFLILQAINLVLSLTNSFALIVNSVIIIFLFYVFSRVRSLSYY